MKKFIGIIVSIAMMIPMFGQAFADGIYYPGTLLVRFCSTDRKGLSNQEMVDLSFCAGYVSGIVAASRCGNKVYGYSSLIPDAVTLDQLQRIVVKWFNDHPEKLHVDGSYLVANALQEAFPCP